MTEIFGWPADETGCGYYRIQLPMQGLAALGHTTSYAQRMPVAVRENPDTIIVGQRIATEGPTELWQNLAAEGGTSSTRSTTTCGTSTPATPGRTSSSTTPTCSSA
ncbi:hypothetical protein ACFQ51_34665 [Streptomyces kaempferi]